MEHGPLVVCADIHGNYADYALVMEQLTPQRVVLLGDYIGYCTKTDGAITLRLIEERTRRAPQDRVLAGNHEARFAAVYPDYRHFLASLSTSTLCSLDNRSLFLCHWPSANIHGNSTNEEVLPLLGGIKADIVLFGHTHQHWLHRSGSGQWVLNPGSLCLTDGRAGMKTFGVLDLARKAWEIFRIDNEKISSLEQHSLV